jgi:hypothetical protein
MKKMSREDHETIEICLTYWANDLLDAKTAVTVLKYYGLAKYCGIV